MKSIIGQKYIPNDNSYSVNLTYPGRDHRLAGNMGGDKPKETKILTEPYEFLIKSDVNRDKGHKYLFIQVEYKGDVVRVLYRKENVNANLKQRIERANEHISMFLH